MKIVFVFFFTFVLSFSLFAQPVFKKQISFLDFDVRNPSFIETGDFGYSSYWFGSLSALVFEGYKDTSKPQIFTLKYDLEKDSFSTPTQITFSKGSCINPCGVFTPIGNIAAMGRIIWQTNENGNWDIAYGELWGDTLRNVRFIAKDSLLDETNPRLVIQGRQGYRFDFGITYEKGGSVYLYFEVDTLKVTEKIFDAAGVDSYEYENASGAIWLEYQNKNYYGTIAAVKKFQNGEKEIVYKTKNYNTGNWNNEKFLYDSLTTTVSPKLFEGLGDFVTAFETIVEGKRKLKYFYNISVFGHPELAENISDSSYESFNFTTKQIEIITKSLAKTFYGYGQSMYQIKKEGKNYLRPSFYSDQYPYKDSLIELKLSEPKITTGLVGYKNQAIWAYSVWEDSSNGTIQLFGSSGVYDIGGIENETSPQDFTLYQNYPNPFNPSTVISFQLSVNSNVSLKVFDVLGREVAMLMNEEKPEGKYQVIFNIQHATNNKQFASGIFFYQLKVGSRFQTRKMLLLK